MNVKAPSKLPSATGRYETRQSRFKREAKNCTTEEDGEERQNEYGSLCPTQTTMSTFFIFKIHFVVAVQFFYGDSAISHKTEGLVRQGVQRGSSGKRWAANGKEMNSRRGLNRIWWKQETVSSRNIGSHRNDDIERGSNTEVINELIG